MQRSGSTLQFQIAAHLVENAGLGHRIRWDTREPMKKYKGAPELVVAKTHQFTPEKGRELAANRAYGLYIYRDLRDVIVSKMRKEKIPFSTIYETYYVETLLLQERRWLRNKNVLVSRYEDVMANLPAEVVRIAGFLGIEITRAEAEAIASEYSLPKQLERIREAANGSMVPGPKSHNTRYDPHSNLHANHIGGGEIEGWRRKLAPWQIALVEQAAGDWLVERGYRLAFSKAQRYILTLQAAPLRLRRRFSQQQQ